MAVLLRLRRRRGWGAWLSLSVGPDRHGPITPAPSDGQTPRPPTPWRRRANRSTLAALRTALSRVVVDGGPPSPPSGTRSANAAADNKEPRARPMQGHCKRAFTALSPPRRFRLPSAAAATALNHHDMFIRLF